MNIEITAFDTLFFKDGKPFTMGEDTWASGIFPPPPSVIYGMLRTTYAAQKNIPINLIEEKTRNLKINNLLLKSVDNSSELFSFPADLYKLKKEKNAKIMHLKNNNIISNIDKEKYPYVLSPDTNKKLDEKFGKAYLDKVSFEGNYLQNTEDSLTLVDSDEILTLESKLGIGKEKGSNQTSEGKLYRVGMNRPKVKFVVDFEGLELENEGFLKFGAENKAAHYKRVDRKDVQFPNFQNGYIKIYLSTPAIFKLGSVPKFIDDGNYNGIEFELLTMAIGKPVYIGGFDMKARKPKPMKKAVPAGSVYYLKCDKAEELVKELHSKSISEIYPEQGFGICYCGIFSI